ncbi:MAG TPA: lysoplasmalogenase family protein, partial [Bacteroidales bacterium]|nr:lysoplasmalogenase family protein [Bacteroidales bacterium]
FWVFVTGSVAITAGYTTLWIMLFSGATLFIISDLILSMQYFGPADNARKPALVVANHVTYYLAQFLIAFSILMVA